MRVLLLSLFAALFYSSPSPAGAQEQNQMDEVLQILRHASNLVKDIPEPNQLSAAMNVAVQQARAGDFQGALTTAHIMQKPEAQSQVLSSFVGVMDYGGDLNGALKLVSSMSGQARNDSYRHLATSHAARGDCEGALRIAHLIQNDPNLLVQSLTAITKKQWESGDQAGGKSTMDAAFSITDKALKENPILANLFTGIAQTEFDAGEPSLAVATLNHFFDIIHQSPDPAAKTNFLPSLAMTLSQIGDTDGALRVIDELPPGTIRDVPLSVVSAKLAQSGDLHAALSSAARISDPQIKASGIRQVAEAQSDSGNAAAAMETVARIPSAAERAAALASLALTQAQKGDSAAGNTVQLAWEAANQASSSVPDHVFEFIAVTRFILGDHTGALEVIHHLSPDSRQWPLQSITIWMAEAGKAAEALSLADEEKEPLPKAYALIGTAQGILDRFRAKAKEDSGRP